MDAAASGGAAPAEELIRGLVERVAPAAEALGDGPALAGVDTILRRGTAAERMRRVHQDTGRLTAVMDWVRAETLLGTGLDRRATQRTPI